MLITWTTATGMWVPMSVPHQVHTGFFYMSHVHPNTFFTIICGDGSQNDLDYMPPKLVVLSEKINFAPAKIAIHIIKMPLY